MKEINTNLLKNTLLFQGIVDEDIASVLTCMSAIPVSYQKGNFIFRSGETTDSVGLVLTGSVHIIKEDFWGNRTILLEASAGKLFGETYASLPNLPLEVSVVAIEPCTILFLNINKIMTLCSSNCLFHTKLIRNFLFIFAQKNLLLTQKMEHISKRSTREKLLSYLSGESIKNSNSSFEIPFNRQQLADYLSVDRSAMSNELSKLQEEGLIEYRKNWFLLK